MELRKKKIFDLTFQTWKTIKSQKQLSATKGISNAKDPANYEDRQLEKYEQIPIDIMLTRPTMVSPKATDQIASKKQAEKKNV